MDIQAEKDPEEEKLGEADRETLREEKIPGQDGDLEKGIPGKGDV